MIWLRNGLLVFDSFDLGGIICVWICLINLINSFIGLPFENEGRTARDTYPGSLQTKKTLQLAAMRQSYNATLTATFVGWARKEHKKL